MLFRSGQLTIVFESKPIDEVINDKNIPKETKDNLLLIADIKKFAVEELGYSESDNYTTFYDQHNCPLMYVVSACPEFSMEEYEWQFPIAGSFTYKGFFERKMADKEIAELKAEGYDVYLGTASGWSTLGWLKDPILSGMLDKSEGELAELIIHELTHSFKYEKDNITFNENLATFIGENGSKLYLNKKYGNDSPQTIEYKNILHDNAVFEGYMTSGFYQLDSLYKGFNSQLSIQNKKELKQKKIANLLEGVSTLPLSDPMRFKYIDKKREQINNAWFAGFKRYNTLQKEFEANYLKSGKSLKKWLQTTDFSQFSSN